MDMVLLFPRWSDNYILFNEGETAAFKILIKSKPVMELNNS